MNKYKRLLITIFKTKKQKMLFKKFLNISKSVFEIFFKLIYYFLKIWT